MKPQLLLKTALTTLLLMQFCGVNAQEALTVEDAVNIALKKNFDILVANNDAETAKINNTAGNAGMLPVIKLAGTGAYEENNEYQKLSGGAVNKYPSLTTRSLSAGTELSWTLFDGGKMFVTKNKLNEIEALGQIEFMNQVLQTQYDVIAAYYDVVRQKQQLASFNEIISYDRERVKIAEVGYNAGSMVKTDLLQAKIDLNVAMENAINQQSVISAALKTLNSLLGQNPDNVYVISDSIPLGYSPNKEELLQKLNTANTSILASGKQVDIAKLALSETRKSYLPLFSLNAGYYLSNSENSEGSVLHNRLYGPQINGTLQIPLFSAGETKRKTAVSRTALLSAEYNFQNTSLLVNTVLQNTLTDFENQQNLLNIEKENNAVARENLEISLQRLRLGQTTSLEVHQAQEYFVQSGTRLINIKYNLKLAETKLKQLISSL
jgi:outer membrane protein